MLSKNSAIAKKAKKGFRGFPVATVAFYGPNKQLATKIAVGIVDSEGEEARLLERWLTDDGVDIRFSATVLHEIDKFIKQHRARSVVMVDGVIGCPHEEGIDYPEGEECPQCTYWHGRDRFTGEMIE